MININICLWLIRDLSNFEIRMAILTICVHFDMYIYICIREVLTSFPLWQNLNLYVLRHASTNIYIYIYAYCWWVHGCTLWTWRYTVSLSQETPPWQIVNMTLRVLNIDTYLYYVITVRFVICDDLNTSDRFCWCSSIAYCFDHIQCWYRYLTYQI